MQMYLWTGKGVDQVSIGATNYPAQGAIFGPPLDATGVSGTIILANDGVGTTSDACEALPSGSAAGKIVLADRGTCAFVVKVKNAQNAGAVGAIIANNAGDSIFTMGGTDATITIPAVFISRTSGTAIKAGLPTAGTIRLTSPPPLQRDGDIDSDIVFHEYGHGLSWRMIGKMSGPMSGAIGEGNSDAFAVRRKALRAHFLGVADHAADFGHGSKARRINLRRATSDDDLCVWPFAPRATYGLPRLPHGFVGHRAGVDDHRVRERSFARQRAHSFAFVSIEAAAERQNLDIRARWFHRCVHVVGCIWKAWGRASTVAHGQNRKARR